MAIRAQAIQRARLQAERDSLPSTAYMGYAAWERRNDRQERAWQEEAEAASFFSTARSSGLLGFVPVAQGSSPIAETEEAPDPFEDFPMEEERPASPEPDIEACPAEVVTGKSCLKQYIAHEYTNYAGQKKHRVGKKKKYMSHAEVAKQIGKEKEENKKTVTFKDENGQLPYK